MKKLQKFLPLFALVLGLGLVLTQSAFKSKTDVRYGYDSTYGWIDVDNLPPGATVDCLMPQLNVTCTQKYNGHPEDPETVVTGDRETGIFVYTPPPAK